jgi:hypothetical protein
MAYNTRSQCGAAPTAAPWVMQLQPPVVDDNANAAISKQLSLLLHPTKSKQIPINKKAIPFLEKIESRIIGIGKDMLKEDIVDYLKGEITLGQLKDVYREYCYTMEELIMLEQVLPDVNDKYYNEAIAFFHMLDGRIFGIAKDVIRGTIREYVKGNIPLQELIDEYEDYCLTSEESFMLSALLPHHNSKKEEAEEEVFVDDLMDEIANLRHCKWKGGCCDYAEENEEMCAKHLKQQEKQRQRNQKRGKKGCSVRGCKNQAQIGGVCMRHGAKVKLCSVRGCKNQAKKKGLCVKHGAKVKLCSVGGCKNQARDGGVCMRHGAKVKLCSVGGCKNQARDGGVCMRHGAKVKLCSVGGCKNQAQIGGVCMRHGAKGKLCSVGGCKNPAVRKGVCRRHGAKTKLCSVGGCKNQAQIGGLCRRHGAKVKL